MRTEVTAALLLGFYTLSQALSLSGEENRTSRRETREVKTALPNPVDCAWSRWSEWTACNPCTKTQHRSRTVEIYGQFGGKSCQGQPVGESQACVTQAVCEPDPPKECSNNEFTCESGACIKARLSCNGDLDCEDASDEDCEPVRRPCGTQQYETNEQGRTAGYGVNILGMEPRMNPFNNDYFNGLCTKVKSSVSNQYNRLPWNVGVLNYETLVEETVSREIYEDTHTLLRELMTETTLTVGAGLNLKFTPTEKSMDKAAKNIEATPTVQSTGNATAVKVNTTMAWDVGLDFEYKRTNMIKNVAEYTTIKNKSFMRVKGRVQLSTYRMRSRDLQVAGDFLEHVKSLPLEYEKGQYFSFLEDYGTHYTRNGKSGGEYDLIYVLNQDNIRDKKVTEKKVQNCIKLGITANFEISSGMGGGAHVRPDYCKDTVNNDTDEKEGKALVDKVITGVRGGTLEAAVAMRTQITKEGLMDQATYVGWARSVGDSPALLRSEPEPIQSLIPLDMPGANTRRLNLKRATEEYEAEYNVCKCMPCHNGATLALLDGQCLCLCPPQFEGLACQDVKTDQNKNSKMAVGGVAQEGNWSCWTPWSGCSGGKRTRTRMCNKQGLTGATCRGDTHSEDYC
ncbi:complement component C9 [Esox lucius]|uniref:Complement component C9 n=1 Tax=Esox lucius TaxID=8010 RepID=A0A3P8XEG3_ESOLU|nr:complement component C9 [Esox lucius]